MDPIKQGIFKHIKEDELSEELTDGREVFYTAREAHSGEERVTDQTHGKNDEQMAYQTVPEDLPHLSRISRYRLEDFVVREKVIMFDKYVRKVAN